MISRKIIRVKTKVTQDGIEPDILMALGFNGLVLEYNADKTEAIMEIWSSDIDELKLEERKDASAFGQFISDLAKEKSFIRILPSHIQSPKVIGEIIGSDGNIKDSSQLNRIGIDAKIAPQIEV